MDCGQGKNNNDNNDPAMGRMSNEVGVGVDVAGGVGVDVAIGKIGKRTSNGEDDATGNECRGHTKSDSGRQLPPPHQQAVTTPHMRVYTAATARGNPTLGCFKVGAICNTTSLRCNPTFGWFKVNAPSIATSLRCNPTFEWHNDGQSDGGITTDT